MKKKYIFLYNDLGVWRVVAYFYDSSKSVSVFLNAWIGNDCYGLKKDISV